MISATDEYPWCPARWTISGSGRRREGSLLSLFFLEEEVDDDDDDDGDDGDDDGDDDEAAVRVTKQGLESPQQNTEDRFAFVGGKTIGEIDVSETGVLPVVKWYNIKLLLLFWWLWWWPRSVAIQ